MYNGCRNLDLIVFEKPRNILLNVYTYCHVSTIACAYIVTLCFHVVLCIATNRFLREIVFYHRYNNMFYRPQIQLQRDSIRPLSQHIVGTRPLQIV